jgi:hypothetical protein
VNINWDYRHVDFDTAVCKTEGGKVLIIGKEIAMKDNKDEVTSLDQLFEKFNKKTEDQFKEILATINAINALLKDA